MEAGKSSLPVSVILLTGLFFTCAACGSGKAAYFTDGNVWTMTTTPGKAASLWRASYGCCFVALFSDKTAGTTAAYS
ncbi:MAG: hypothetical protein LBO04_04820 [Spirochaetaceae bacterium]|jgi:hypothetical protein|nr:hypothetical protein [Spirochaetaceae bacterium]